MDKQKRSDRASVLIIVAVLTLILQVALAPNIAIFSIVPNFMLVAVCAVAISARSTRAAIYGFILGFCYDVFAQGPIGVMALVCTLAGFVLSTIKKDSFGENYFMDLLVILIVILVGEVIHGVVLAVVGYDTDFFPSLVFRVLPSALYEMLLAAIVLFVMNRFRGRGTSGRGTSGRSKKRVGSRVKMSSGKLGGQGRPLNRKLR